MKYVVSDIHGSKTRFDSIMEQIKLKETDALYILGDVIDRGTDGVEILRRIMDMPNVKMLRGNHELMMMEALYHHQENEALAFYYKKKNLRLWYQNGGRITHHKLQEIGETEKQKIFEYLDELPLNYEITVNGQNYILVHAAPAILFDSPKYGYDHVREFCAWKRFEDFPVIKDKTVVFGHTPTSHYSNSSPMKIWHGNGWIGIDCGSAFSEQENLQQDIHGRLGCLRLDDMKEFYSKE